MTDKLQRRIAKVLSSHDQTLTAMTDLVRADRDAFAALLDIVADACQEMDVTEIRTLHSNDLKALCAIALLGFTEIGLAIGYRDMEENRDN